MPTPAATRPCLPSHWADSKQIFGSKPAALAARRSGSAHAESRPSIQTSSREVGHADLRRVGQRVVARDREVLRVVHQVVEHDLAGQVAALGVGDDREVELAGGDAVDQLAR